MFVQARKNFSRKRACPFCGSIISMNMLICNSCVLKQPQKIRKIYEISITILKIMNVIGAIFSIIWFLEFYFRAFDLGVSMNNMFIIIFSVLGFWLVFAIFTLIFLRIILKNPNKAKENQQVP